ncbi:hypothetical protein LZ009_06170 [Ramlibacter sp. XY19]|uniref:hypothetical protein n=1 Tax=Ramlibacter paludis TaxID=2908000 RepID=UPI0023DB6B2E|nr:hypothetical protein [Ramlibacter paludis]MCG2592364.1 hypothetical protein [Ramlibacter paludis]
MPDLVKPSIWAAQEVFRNALERRAEDVLFALGIEHRVEAFLVGISRGPGARRSILVEPEMSGRPNEMFTDARLTLEAVAATQALNKNSKVDDDNGRGSELLACQLVQHTIQSALTAHDGTNQVRSFAGPARSVGAFYVVPVVELPQVIFLDFPPFKQFDGHDRWFRRGPRSLIEAAMQQALDDASEELAKEEPASSFRYQRSGPEAARLAAHDFMQTIANAVCSTPFFGTLFESINTLSALSYERKASSGVLLLVDPTQDSVDYAVRLRSPVDLRELRWARKLLQMTTSDLFLVADAEKIYGLGTPKAGGLPGVQVTFAVHFLDQFHWELRFAGRGLIRSDFGNPRVPKDLVDKALFFDNLQRMFPAAVEAHSHLWKLLLEAARIGRGSMIVIAEDAAFEAERLLGQGTAIETVPLTTALFHCVSGIDGSILIDPWGNCFAVGVILDGNANSLCTPSRGSRYNSGVRYISSPTPKRLAIVVSDDGSMDIIPPLRLRISRSAVERQLQTLERATIDDYHESRNWLDERRFYLDLAQCDRANAALARIESQVQQQGQVYIEFDPFVPDENMDPSYLLP